MQSLLLDKNFFRERQAESVQVEMALQTKIETTVAKKKSASWATRCNDSGCISNRKLLTVQCVTCSMHTITDLIVSSVSVCFAVWIVYLVMGGPTTSGHGYMTLEPLCQPVMKVG